MGTTQGLLLGLPNLKYILYKLVRLSMNGQIKNIKISDGKVLWTCSLTSMYCTVLYCPYDITPIAGQGCVYWHFVENKLNMIRHYHSLHHGAKYVVEGQKMWKLACVTLNVSCCKRISVLCLGYVDNFESRYAKIFKLLCRSYAMLILATFPFYLAQVTGVIAVICLCTLCKNVLSDFDCTEKPRRLMNGHLSKRKRNLSIQM